MVLVFAISLALRLLVLGFAASEAPLLYDERDYYERSVAWAAILGDLAQLEAIPEPVLVAAYGGGHWPPLHPVLLGIGLALGGERVGVARLVMVLISSLTTVLVCRVTLKLASPTAAWAAAGLHLLYPTFVAYSHYLWSETTVVCLLLWAVLIALEAPSAPSRLRLALYTVGTGLLLGLAALTRAAAAPFLVVVPAWLAFVIPGRRGKAAALGLTLVASLAVLAPWQAVLSSTEGRLVPLSTLGGYNLALGNNPWIPPGYGSSWGHETSKARVKAALEERAQGRSWEASGSAFAWEEIQRSPGAAAGRCLQRLQMLWAPDVFPLRHLFHATYRPVPPHLASLLIALAWVSYFGLLALIVLGLVGERHPTLRRGLLASMALGGMLLPALSVASPRLHLPLLALLLPAAGNGVALALRGRRFRPHLAAVVIILALWGVVATTLPRVLELYLLPSSHYAPALKPWDRLLGSHSLFSDRLLLRRSDGAREILWITVMSPGGSFRDGSRTARRRLFDSRERVLDLFSSDGTASHPLEIALESRTTGREVRLRPITRQAWRRWTPSGIDGVEYMWSGGGPSPR